MRPAPDPSCARSRHRQRRPLRVYTALVVGAIGTLTIAALTGCETRVVRNDWEDWANQAQGRKTSTDPDTDSSDDVARDGKWAIATDQFAGPQHRQLAEQRVAHLKRASGMANFWAVDEGGKSTVYYGRYDSPQDDGAKADLDRLKRLHESDSVRLASLMLVPLTIATDAPDSGQMGEFDLRRAAGRAAYTLQIGFYESDSRAEARKAAEQAVAVLRRDNVPAFYFHGPHRSMVTVGLFGEDAVSSSTQGRQIQTLYSAQVKTLQEKYPHNLANGAPIVETRQGVATEQPSFLVRVPQY